MGNSELLSYISGDVRSLSPVHGYDYGGVPVSYVRGLVVMTRTVVWVSTGRYWLYNNLCLAG